VAFDDEARVSGDHRWEGVHGARVPIVLFSGAMLQLIGILLTFVEIVDSRSQVKSGDSRTLPTNAFPLMLRPTVPISPPKFTLMLLNEPGSQRPQRRLRGPLAIITFRPLYFIITRRFVQLTRNSDSTVNKKLAGLQRSLVSLPINLFSTACTVALLVYR